MYKKVAPLLPRKYAEVMSNKQAAHVDADDVCPTNHANTVLFVRERTNSL